MADSLHLRLGPVTGQEWLSAHCTLRRELSAWAGEGRATFLFLEAMQHHEGSLTNRGSCLGLTPTNPGLGISGMKWNQPRAICLAVSHLHRSRQCLGAPALTSSATSRGWHPNPWDSSPPPHRSQVATFWCVAPKFGGGVGTCPACPSPRAGTGTCAPRFFPLWMGDAR